jgi:hypothetical protein
MPTPTMMKNMDQMKMQGPKKIINRTAREMVHKALN